MYFNTCIQDTGNACVNMIANSPGYDYTSFLCVFKLFSMYVS